MFAPLVPKLLDCGTQGGVFFGLCVCGVEGVVVWLADVAKVIEKRVVFHFCIVFDV